MAKFAPAVEVAARLRKLITGQGIPIPDEIASTPDPIKVFTYSFSLRGGPRAPSVVFFMGAEDVPCLRL
jgi:hypothetical protein